MADSIPKNFFDKLEREWRLIDPQRPKPEEKPQPISMPKRLKISRVD
jgi:hypothetical protein